jgi:hypothetical protein
VSEYLGQRETSTRRNNNNNNNNNSVHQKLNKEPRGGKTIEILASSIFGSEPTNNSPLPREAAGELLSERAND